MTLTPQDLQTLCLIAISAANQAGQRIASANRKMLQVKMKEGGENLASQVVTEVDIASQTIILAVLEPTFAKYDLGLLAEESADPGSRLTKDYFWCIDPLDGTLPFVDGTNGYAVSIALVSQDGKPMIGVVYDPDSHTLYHAVAGQGTFRNGELWKPINAESSTLNFFCDRSFLERLDYVSIHAQFEQIATALGCNGLKVTAFAGAVMNAIWALENGPAFYIKLPKDHPGGGSLWDYAATAGIYQEAGAWCSDMFGNLMELNRKESVFMNHKGVLYASSREIAQAITSGS